jgi:hypothetical protein
MAGTDTISRGADPRRWRNGAGKLTLAAEN